ncbi:PAS domain S-box protein [Roseivivax sp. CAU 1761]
MEQAAAGSDTKRVVWNRHNRERQHFMDKESAMSKDGDPYSDVDVPSLDPSVANAVLSQLVEGVIVTDLDGRIIFVNDAAERLHGAKLLGVIPSEYASAYSLLTEDGQPYPPDLLPLSRAVLRGETVTDAKWRIVRPDGTVVHAIGSATPVRDREGRPAGAALTIRDDGLRLNYEASLREHEIRLQTLVDNLPGGVVYQIETVDEGPERRFTYISPSHFALTGIPAERVLEDAQVAYDLIHPDDRQSLAQAETEALARQEALDIEVRFIRADGAIRWCRLISAPRTSAEGGLVWDGMQIDITDQKAAEEEIEESRRRMDAILNNTRMAVFLMDARQHCVYANAAAEELTGYSFAEMEGRPLHDVVHHTRPDGSPYPLEECPIDRAFPERAQVEGEELFIARDGSFYPVAFTASPVLDDAEKPVGTVIEVRSIAAEKAAAEAEKLLAHEVDHRAKNALALVQSIVRLTPFVTRDAYVSAIEGRIAALAGVHSLLAQNRWTGASLLTVIERELAAYADGNSDRLQLSGPTATIKPELLQPLSMIIHELATNAVKYGSLSAPGGSIAVTWTLTEQLEIVWTERGGPEVSEPETIGFGSRLMAGAAKQIGGSVEHFWPKEGLRCRISVPAERIILLRDTDRWHSTGPASDVSTVAGKRVLIVEDEALIAFDLERLLSDAGAEVLGPVFSLDQATELAANEDFDCAVLDANLAGFSSRQLWESFAAQGKPFVILTGYENLDAPPTCRVLRKPVEEAQLIAALSAELLRTS